jgi:hypothetical protein
MPSDSNYWDPIPAARAASAVLNLPGLRGQSIIRPAPEKFLLGRWEDRNWRNVPGPFYGADTDTCETGPVVAPRHVLADEDGQEFVFRQPRTTAEVESVLDAAWSDPFRGYAGDGHDHWTADGIRAWWADRARLREWAVSSLDTGPHHIDAGPVLNELIAYLDGELASHLRDYLFWLEERRHPTAEITRPDL